MNSCRKVTMYSKIENVLVSVLIIVCFLPQETLELNEAKRKSRSIFDVIRSQERTMTINTMNFRFRPFITCWNCTSFAACLRICPFKEYPGLDQSGTYIPSDSGQNNFPITSQDGPSTSSLQPSSLRINPSYKHSYRNYKPYNPTKIKEQYRHNYGYRLKQTG